MDSDSNERFYKGDEDDDSDPDLSYDNEETTSTQNKREHKLLQWTPEKTHKLIDLFKRECPELWDPRHPEYRFRSKRVEKQQYLADHFETTLEEINRKLHNLRSQFNNQLRKMKKKGILGTGTSADCGWEYFDAMAFLAPTASLSTFIVTARAGTSNPDPLGFNVELAEFQIKEEEQFKKGIQEKSSASIKRVKVTTPGPPPLPSHALPMLLPEQAMAGGRSTNPSDACQIFGDFVAAELRSLKSDESRKKLKRIIQKAILQVGEDEDLSKLSG